VYRQVIHSHFHSGSLFLGPCLSSPCSNGGGQP
jgi:hypothetical protein